MASFSSCRASTVFAKEYVLNQGYHCNSKSTRLFGGTPLRPVPVGFGVFFSSNVVSFVHLPQCAQGFREFTCFATWPKISGCVLGFALAGVTLYARFGIMLKPCAYAVDPVG